MWLARKANGQVYVYEVPGKPVAYVKSGGPNGVMVPKEGRHVARTWKFQTWAGTGTASLHPDRSLAIARASWDEWGE